MRYDLLIATLEHFNKTLAITMKTLSLSLLSIMAGVSLTFAFAPFHIFPLAILSPAILLTFWLDISPKKAFWLGWVYGLGFFGTGVYWIFISVNTYGNTSTVIAALITSALMAFLALYPALTGYFLNRFFPQTNSTKILCAFPAIWVLSEWVRSWLFTGFPWLMLGYSQMTSPLKYYAPVAGVYGVSLAVLLSSGLLVWTRLLFKKSAAKKLIYLNIYRFTLIWIIGIGLSFHTWTKPAGDPVKVSLVQGNIAQDVKWSPNQVQPTLDHYVDLTEPHWDSKIIIWPESAIPLPLQSATDFVDKINQVAGDHEATFITGIPVKATDREGYYNAVIALGKGEGVYLKHRLVPFGEFIPLRHVFGHLMDLLHVPMSDFISGEKMLKPIMANGIKIATFICYEIAYPELVLSHDADTDMILTVSNDAWFGRSIAQAQHIEMAAMRALEMGRPVLFVANDGITGIINSRGKIQSAAPQHESYVLTDTVQGMHGKTPWQQFAMDPLLLILFLLLFFAVYFRHRHVNET